MKRTTSIMFDAAAFLMVCDHDKATCIQVQRLCARRTAIDSLSGMS